MNGYVLDAIAKPCPHSLNFDFPEIVGANPVSLRMIAVGLMLLGEREEFVAVSHDPIVSIGILRQDLSEIRSVMLLVAVNDRFRIPLVDAGFPGAARTRASFSGRIVNANSIVIKNDAQIRVCKIHIRSVGIAVQFQIFTA